ncbi:hypothetical protein SOCEGT47_035840 [Sorangium cellulosum]|uniref:Secreted protein n=1 Tax=Sorangium cellulosum TaxID=56 RepID=A0A4P2Q292_SORCE|nr:hypothetical protein [Sorangium cellulosum]AUX23066.1 hypothetical protein SOCEGT47_035840 [Sorangium cellulosum]
MQPVSVRPRARCAAPLLLALAVLACDDPRAQAPAAPASSAAPTPSAAPAPSAAAPPAATGAAKRPMPPRPFPLGSSGPVQPSAPPEQQMMAIQYTLAMVSPQPTDPLVDKGYLEAILPKLAAAARTADKGKTPPDPAKPAKGNRKIEVDMGRGCTERTPANLLAQRAGSSLKEAFDAGILVISCHDDKWECHQSTRDPGDVLCHAAPRR